MSEGFVTRDCRNARVFQASDYIHSRRRRTYSGGGRMMIGRWRGIGDQLASWTGRASSCRSGTNRLSARAYRHLPNPPGAPACPLLLYPCRGPLPAPLTEDQEGLRLHPPGSPFGPPRIQALAERDPRGPRETAPSASSGRFRRCQGVSFQARTARWKILVTISDRETAVWCSLLHLAQKTGLCKLHVAADLCKLLKIRGGFDSLHPLHS
jgi:hypothetical protein